MDLKIILKDRPSKQIKKLILEREENGLGVYKLETEWPGCSSLDNYCQISYSNTPDGKKLNTIDFDGGPMLGIGSYVGDYKIVDFLFDDDFENIKFVLKSRY